MIKPVFMYYILNHNNSNIKGKPLILGYKVIKSKCFDFKYYDSSWMGDKDLGKICFVPDLGLSEEEFIFLKKDYSEPWMAEDAALKKMAELYASQLSQ